MANALIRANKRFDLVLLPGQHHGYADMVEYFYWRMADYFSKYLLGDSTERPVEMEEINRELEQGGNKGAKGVKSKPSEEDEHIDW